MFNFFKNISNTPKQSKLDKEVENLWIEQKERLDTILENIYELEKSFNFNDLTISEQERQLEDIIIETSEYFQYITTELNELGLVDEIHSVSDSEIMNKLVDMDLIKIKNHLKLHESIIIDTREIWTSAELTPKVIGSEINKMVYEFKKSVGIFIV